MVQHPQPVQVKAGQEEGAIDIATFEKDHQGRPPEHLFGGCPGSG